MHFLDTILASVTFGLPALASTEQTLRSRDDASWPDPVGCSGNCSAIHDPSVVRRESDGKWFRFNTNGDIGIASASDITGPWSYEGVMLDGGSAINISDAQQAWAPDVSKIGDTYYGYYAISSLGSQDSQIGVATSSSLDPGTWTDHGSIEVPSNSSYNRIDPNWFRENATSTPYLQFGSSWNGIYQTTLSDDFLDASSSNIVRLVYNSTVPADSTSPAIVEGAFLFWWVPDADAGEKYYYLFFSSGACCNAADSLAGPGDEYKIMVCRSSSVSGPYVDEEGNDCAAENGGTLVLGSHGEVYAPGGQGVLYDSDLGSPIVYYHYVNTSIGYATGDFQFGFNYLNFSSGWPVVSS